MNYRYPTCRHLTVKFHTLNSVNSGIPDISVVEQRVGLVYARTPKVHLFKSVIQFQVRVSAAVSALLCALFSALTSSRVADRVCRFCSSSCFPSFPVGWPFCARACTMYLATSLHPVRTFRNDCISDKGCRLLTSAAFAAACRGSSESSCPPRARPSPDVPVCLTFAGTGTRAFLAGAGADSSVRPGPEKLSLDCFPQRFPIYAF